MKRFAWLAGLIVVLALAGWLALGGEAVRARGFGAKPVAAEPEAAKPSAVPPPIFDTTPQAEEPEAPVEAAREPAARTAVIDEELARGKWVEGRVLFPAGTPLDEQVFVEARGKKFENGERHRVEVAADGSFRVAFSEKTKAGFLALEARYVFLRGNVHWKADAASPVTLEPELGGRIEGRLLVPGGAELGKDDKLELHSEVKTSANSSTGDQVPLKPDAGRAFEAGALDPGATYSLVYEGETLIGTSPEFRVEPGKIKSVDLALRAGVVLAGHVRDEAGDPVHEAKVDATVGTRHMQRNHSVQSSADGSFRFPALEPGDFELEVTAAGYEPLKKDLGPLEAGERQETLAFVVARGNAIRGRLLWPDGKPAEGWVAVVQDRRTFSFPSADEQKTAADGSFTISGLGEGAFELRARAIRTEEVTVKSELTGRERKKKERSTWNCVAKAVAVGTSDLVMTLSEGLVVSGRVVDESGAPIDAFRLVAMPSSHDMFAFSQPRSEAFREAGGAFRMTAFTEGSWTITASAEGFADSAPVTVALPSTELVELVLRRAASLSGTVVDPAGAPVAEAFLELDRESSHTIQMFGSNDEEAKTDAQGRFTIANAAPGWVELTASKSGFAPSVPQRLELVAGRSSSGLLLQLQRGGTITGEVVAGIGSSAGLSVHLWCMSVRSYSASVETDADGRFSFLDVPADTFHLQTETEGGLELEAEVELTEGATAHVRLAPASTAFVKLYGRILVGGEAASDHSIRASLADEHESGDSSSETDSEGNYELTLAGAGRYRLWINHWSGGPRGGSHSWHTTVDVPSVREHRLDLAIPVARIRGRVTSSSREPLAGIRVQATGAADDPTSGGHDSHATTDSDGRYELTVTAGQLVLVAGASDWGGARSPWAAAQRDGLALAAGQTLEGIDFVLERGGTLAVRVTNPDGSPASDIGIYKQDGTRREWLDSNEEGGVCTIGSLLPGRLVVGAASEHGISSPVAVEIVAGETTTIELRLAPAAAVLLSFPGLASTGEELVVTLDRDGQPVSDSVQVWEGQAFLGPLVAGNYVVHARCGALAGERALVIRGDEGRLELELTLE